MDVGVGMGGCVCIIVHVCVAVHVQVASFLLHVYGVSNCVQERAILAESKVTKLKKTVQSLQVSLLGISTWCVCVCVCVGGCGCACMRACMCKHVAVDHQLCCHSSSCRTSWHCSKARLVVDIRSSFCSK